MRRFSINVLDRIWKMPVDRGEPTGIFGDKLVCGEAMYALGSLFTPVSELAGGRSLSKSTYYTTTLTRHITQTCVTTTLEYIHYKSYMHAYVRTYARTHACTHARTHSRTPHLRPSPKSEWGGLKRGVVSRQGFGYFEVLY